MNNNISDLQEELKKMLAMKFFFKEPTSKKVLAYSAIFFILAIVGSFFNLGVIAAFFSVLPLCYILGARGYGGYLPLVVFGIVIFTLLSSPYIALWFGLHTMVSAIIYEFIVRRYSKVSLVLFTATFLFFASTIYTYILIRLDYIKYSASGVTAYVENYINQTAGMYGIKQEMFKEAVEVALRGFPVTIFIILVLYVLALLQYTLSMLSKESVIIPAFPKFSRITLRPYFGGIYVALVFISYFFTLEFGDFDFWSILSSNLVSVMRWLFILNGLFMAFFFVEQKKDSILTKVLLTSLMFLMPGIFEIIGLTDCILKVRENYIIMKNRR